VNRRLVKLVRDGIQAFLGGDVTIEYTPLSEDEHRRALRRKLIEEGVEYMEDPCLGELADVYEAVRALAKRDLGLEMDDVIRLARIKRAERGGFDGGTGMFAVLPAEHVMTDHNYEGRP
jgi:predicted house-cleaning noncanonical NTP pyrophosphatase (MazG superfamily)